MYYLKNSLKQYKNLKCNLEFTNLLLQKIYFLLSSLKFKSIVIFDIFKFKCNNFGFDLNQIFYSSIL